MYVVQIAENARTKDTYVVGPGNFFFFRIFCDFDDHLVFYNGQCQELLKILNINISV